MERHEQTAMNARIISFLEEHNVLFERFEHEHVHRSEDAAKIRGTRLEEAAKALVLEIASGTLTSSGKLIMCVVPGHRRIDMKSIKLLLGQKNVSLAHPDKVLAETGCPVGTVPPFANLFDKPLQIYADDDIFSRDYIVFSAGSHHHSVRMRADDWKRLVNPIVSAIGKDAIGKEI